ncbi:hypothetical protein MNBD_GAMMA08-2203 [hydrothermal vent metagenome]|uniref:Uncharacterized protein n=1 Tax=hydrothermal vent metagenome TaxID=652676 RepID=A0A3B0XS38_9ZZZZ
MNINTKLSKFLILGILLCSSRAALSATVTISFTADITFVNADFDAFSPTPDESWLDRVNNNIFAGDQLTGTLTYHTNPDPVKSSPGGGVFRYTDPEAFLSFTIPSAGYTWGSSIFGDRPLRMDVNNANGSERAALNTTGYGASDSFPEELYRGNDSAFNILNLNLRITERFLSDTEVPLQLINMDNLLVGSGRIFIAENVQDELLGDFLAINFTVTDVNTTISSVPLPASLWLFISGMLVLFRYSKK